MDTGGLVVFGLNPQSVHTEPELVRFYQELERRLRALPGVEAVTVMADRLGSGWSSNSNMKVDGRDPVLAQGTSALVCSNDIGLDFFHTLRVPVVLGRESTDADTATTQPVAIVNELFVQRFLPGQNPLGHRVNGLAIVGVVKNHKYRSMNEEPIPMAWWDYAQAPNEGEMNMEMRVRGDALAILPSARKVVTQLDPDAPLIQPVLQRVQFERSVSHQVMFARLAEFFGLLAMVLVAIGLYGTLAYRVNLRTAEIGVRMAVGARREQVDSQRQSAARGGGVLMGIPLAMLVGRASLKSSLYGVKPLDAVSYLLATGALAAVALAASALPASRAASVDPLTALRTEGRAFGSALVI
jgi:hypothetical protein